MLVRLLLALSALLLFAGPGHADGGDGFSKAVCLIQTQADIKETASKFDTEFQDVEIKTDPEFTERYYATLESMGDWNGKRALDYVEPYENVKGSTAVALFEGDENGAKVLHAMFINENTCAHPVYRMHYKLHQEVMKRQ